MLGFLGLTLIEWGYDEDDEEHVTDVSNDFFNALHVGKLSLSFEENGW